MDITIAISIFGSLINVLRMLDSDDKAKMGYLYETMDHAKKSTRQHLKGNGDDK